MYFDLGSRWGSSHRWLAWRLFASWLLCVGVVRAEEPHPGESERAIPAVLRVGVPTESAATVVTAASIGYGFMDETDVVSGGHRLRSTAAVAVSPLPELGFGLDLRGHVDRFGPADRGDDTKLYGEPRLSARYVLGLSRELHLGFELDARFVGAEAPSIEPSAISPSARGLFAWRLEPRTWLTSQLGFHLDRSARAVPEVAVLGSADQRTLGASSWNALQWGLGASHRLNGSELTLLAELAGELLVGSGKPRPSRSPSHVGLGARYDLTPAFSLMGTAEVSTSRRPTALVADEFVPMEPRLSASVVAILRFGLPEKERPPEPPPALTEAPEPAPEQPPPMVEAPPTMDVAGTVVDEGGRPLADVEITLVRDGAEPESVRSFADGTFQFQDVPKGAAELRLTTPGFESVVVAVGAEQQAGVEVVMRPAVPAGQLRGKVLDLQGEPIAATISVAPGGREVQAGADGAFELELQPGRYTITFRHDDFSTQQRRIHVRDKGVVILNIALTR